MGPPKFPGNPQGAYGENHLSFPRFSDDPVVPRNFHGFPGNFLGGPGHAMAPPRRATASPRRATEFPGNFRGGPRLGLFQGEYRGWRASARPSPPAGPVSGTEQRAQHVVLSPRRGPPRNSYEIPRRPMARTTCLSPGLVTMVGRPGIFLRGHGNLADLRAPAPSAAWGWHSQIRLWGPPT